MIDEMTRLDNVLAISGKFMQFNYTLLNLDKSEIDMVTHDLESSVINNVKTNPTMKIYRDNKATVIFNYKDKNGAFAWELSVTPDMYE